MSTVLEVSEDQLRTADEDLPKIIVAQEESAMFAEPMIVSEEDYIPEPEDADRGEFIDVVIKKRESTPSWDSNNESSMMRAMAYLVMLKRKIEQTVSSDVEAEFTMNELTQIDAIKDEIARDVAELEKKLQGLQNRKTRFSSEETGLKKEATTPQLVIVPDKFIHDLTRDLINGKVSSGKELSAMFDHVVKRFSLDKREQYMLVNNLRDAGYPLHRPMAIDFGPEQYYG